jgi:hypothetical protein
LNQFSGPDFANQRKELFKSMDGANLALWKEMFEDKPYYDIEEWDLVSSSDSN